LEKSKHAEKGHSSSTGILTLFPPFIRLLNLVFRMAASREKQRAHRKKRMEAVKSSVKLHEPISTETQKEKIKVPVKAKSALVPGEQRSMGMEVD